MFAQLRRKAKEYLSQKKFEDALACLETAIELHSTSYKVRGVGGGLAEGCWRPSLSMLLMAMRAQACAAESLGSALSWPSAQRVLGALASGTSSTSAKS